MPEAQDLNNYLLIGFSISGKLYIGLIMVRLLHFQIWLVLRYFSSSFLRLWISLLMIEAQPLILVLFKNDSSPWFYFYFFQMFMLQYQSSIIAICKKFDSFLKSGMSKFWSYFKKGISVNFCYKCNDIKASPFREQKNTQGAFRRIFTVAFGRLF